MKNKFCTSILMLCFALSAHSQDELIEGGSGITQLTENIDALLEPVDGGVLGGGLVSGDDPMETNLGEAGDGETQVPIDGGLSLLLAAGAAYGARRLRKTALEKKKAKGDE